MTSSVKYALFAVAVVLFFSLALNLYQFNTLNITKNDLQNQVTDLASQISRLQEQLNATKNVVSTLQEENG